MGRNLFFDVCEHATKRLRIKRIEEGVNLRLGHTCIVDNCLVVDRNIWEPGRIYPSFELGNVCEIVLGAYLGDLVWVGHQGILLHVPGAVCSFRKNVLRCVA